MGYSQRQDEQRGFRDRFGGDWRREASLSLLEVRGESHKRREEKRERERERERERGGMGSTTTPPSLWRPTRTKTRDREKKNSVFSRESSAMASSACALADPSRAHFCRDSAAASHLKLVSIGIILVTSAFGISAPVALARVFHGRPAYELALLLIKCFAAGVILSTSLVHVLPDAFAALADCQLASRHPWRDFPFSGFVSLIGVLLALLVDFAATSHATEPSAKPGYTPIGSEEAGKAAAIAVEMGCHGVAAVRDEEERLEKLKQRMVSQVLEIGIVFHSVIIGVTMGMSQNRCTIRPLVAALAFHQIFEGMGLGGCIAQAGFSLATVGYMCIMFSVTTPLGIVLGMLIFYLTGYDDSSPNALILEGLLGSLSAGVLVYMALVDLIAVDFFHNKTMSSSPRLKIASYIALVLGSAAMSVLALWA